MTKYPVCGKKYSFCVQDSNNKLDQQRERLAQSKQPRPRQEHVQR
jgi:hypothetical protein